MARRTSWMTTAHVDSMMVFLEQDLSTLELSAKMSKKFGYRISPAHVTALLGRMRKPGDEFFHNIPYRRNAVKKY